MFYAVRDIETDGDQNIYVMETGNHRIQVFDRNGKYLRTIGKKGQGPGEFNLLICIDIDEENGRLYAADKNGRKIVLFDLKGNYLDMDIRLEDSPESIAVDSNADVCGVFSEQILDSRKYVKKVSSSGGPTEEYFAVASPIKKISTSSTSGLYFNMPYENDLFLSSIGKNMFIYASSDAYRLYGVDEEGEKLFESTKDEDPRKIPQADKDKFISKIRASLMTQGKFVSSDSFDFPDHLPYIFDLLSDDNGRIYVQRTSKAEAAVNGYVFDVFDREGIFIYMVQTDYYPYLIEGGCLYTVIVGDETGTESVVRFRIKNWDAIKGCEKT
ncbi:MAG: 6-bladed beta-propeller [Acidobacteria bacterium]|nr:6-bladed beta-propeller [Acidobacteriota bacterium]